MKKYVTVQGDMWDSIAYKQMGDTKHTHTLMKANMEFRNIYTFPAGIELTIPEVDESVNDTVLPPWKQVSG